MVEPMDILVRQREFFHSGRTLDISFRMDCLKRLRQAIKESEAEILEALELDLGKAPFEAYATEVGMVLAEIRFALSHLKSWARPKSRRTPLMHFPASSRVYCDPLGVVLILSPWNYPFQLALEPLIAAVAAGNCAVIKPSRNAPNTTWILERILARCFPPEYVSVARGGDNLNQFLLEYGFDHIFFTGSAAVGRKVMSEAAKTLTPVTLELGGKSPCIVEQSANLELTARRIAWGKGLAAGQTCVAPDYVLVERKDQERLAEGLKKYFLAFYGATPLRNPDYPRIINEKHFDRLMGLLQKETVFSGGQLDRHSLKIEPTVVTDTDLDSPLMRDEIFGPILPLIPYDRLEDALDYIRSGEKPLSLYLFTENRSVKQQVMRTLSFGSGCINDTVVQVSNPHLGFGGVGASGMGSYHGKDGFETFSHKKSVLKQSTRLDLPFRYPPYAKGMGLLKFFLR